MPPESGIEAERTRWHFHPGRAVQNNPLFAWPPQPMAVLHWYRAYWVHALMHWDRWFGAFHDGSGAATARTRAFKKQMYTK